MAVNEKYPLALGSGTVLAGQYIIDDVLGQGGFGITYKATDYKTKNKVAIKEFFPETLAYRENTTVVSYTGERAENYQYGKDAFLQEAKTLAEFIGCENIVRIHSYFEENGTAYLVMDYVEGVGFDDYLKEHDGKISFEDAKRILVPIMDALALVHSRGIIHRDVTPDNIFITNEGVVKLLDFGAARYSLGDKSRSLDIILKHGFAPKEQYIRRGKQGPYTDVYSLGATFYFALTGKRPPDSVERLDDGELIPPSSIGVQISEAEENAIFKALEVQFSERYQTMTEFKNALLGVQETPVQLTQMTQQSQGAETVANSPKKGIKRIIIVIIVIVIGIIAVVAAVVIPTVIKTINSGTETTQEDEGSGLQETTQLPTTTEVETTTQQPTTTAPPETTAPEETTTVETESEKVSIIGNRVGNINNNGLVLHDGKYFVGSNGLAIKSGLKEEYKETILTVESGQFSNLLMDNNNLYFICNGFIYIYDTSTDEFETVASLEKYSADYMRFYLSEDYYFVYTRNKGETDGTIYRISRKTGKEEQSIKVGGEKQFIFFDKYLYYVKNSSSGSYIYMVSSADFANQIESYNTKNGYVYGVVTASDSYIYVTAEKDGDSRIVKFSWDFKNVENEINLTEECKSRVGDTFTVTTMNVIKDQMVICVKGTESTNPGVYHLNINGESVIWDTIRNVGNGFNDVNIMLFDNCYGFGYLREGFFKYVEYDLDGNYIEVE